MKKSIHLSKQQLFILLIILLLSAQCFFPYKSTASSNISDGVVSIHLIGDHNSDKYWFGQCLIPLKINAYMESGNHVGSIPVENSWISGYNSGKLGKQVVTISYGGKTTTFTVTVVDYLKDITIDGLKTNYKVGETLDLSGASITEITASGIRTTGKSITSNMISGFSTVTPGVKKITINYHKNELGENIKLDTFITVSDYISNAPISTPTVPASYKPLSTEVSENTSPKSSTLFNALKKSKPPISKVDTDNEEIIDSNKNNKIDLNNIFKSIFEISEIELDQKTASSVKLFILIISKLSILFI